MSSAPLVHRAALSAGADRQLWTAPSLSARRRRIRLHASHLALWTLQGWLSMFYFAAGYAKLTEPVALLTVLMDWPSLVPLGLVRAVGGLEAGLAVLSLAPLLSWRFGHGLLIVTAGGLLAVAAIFLGYHALHDQLGLATINLFLIVVTATILRGRRHRPEGPRHL